MKCTRLIILIASTLDIDEANRLAELEGFSTNKTNGDLIKQELRPDKYFKMVYERQLTTERK